MEQLEVQETIKKIKRNFSLRMNGVASASMREKGIGGYLNWGVGFPVLRGWAEEYGKDYELAAALWKENVRECKILSTLIMPAGRMDGEMMTVWLEQTTTQEIAEYAAYNLFQYVEGASDYAFIWLASADTLAQVCGYNMLAGLFRRGAKPADRDVNEFVDQAVTALSDESAGVRHAANNCLGVFASLGEMQKKIVESALKRLEPGQG